MAKQDADALTDEDEEFTCSVPEAGRRFLGLGKNGSYDAARLGIIPTIRVGGRLKALIQPLKRNLRDGPRPKEAA